MDTATASDREIPTDRSTLVSALTAEIMLFRPRDWLGAFRRWHEGSLSLVHLSVLALLDARGPQSMSQLADALDLSVASMTGIVDRMESHGFVERRRDDADRRVVHVQACGRGLSVFEDMDARRQEHLETLLGQLTDEDLAGFLRGMRAMHSVRARGLEAAR